MSNLIKKGVTIAKAFLNDLPEGQDWYEERLKICGPCEYSTANKAEEELTFTDKLKIKSGLCGEGPHCTACGCCIRQKTSVKTEVCGLVELGKTPKWTPLEVTNKSGDLSILLTNSSDIVKSTSTEFLYDFGVKNDNVVKTTFIFRSKKNIKFSKTSVGCGCTHVENVETLDDKNLKLDVTISTVGFRQGLNEKTMNIEYKDSSSNFKTVTIRFRLIKL